MIRQILYLKPYVATRFFTGMRSAEINGLLWKHIDFQMNQILVRQSLVRGEIQTTKTDGSEREILMNSPLKSHLESHRKNNPMARLDDFVFMTPRGNPVDGHNFANRIWPRILRRLDIRVRRPYQTRHSAATFLLASGENPEWVARMLGHVNTTMLFSRYSRYIPNLTRNDGTAYERVLAQYTHWRQTDEDDASPPVD